MRIEVQMAYKVRYVMEEGNKKKVGTSNMHTKMRQ